MAWQSFAIGGAAFALVAYLLLLNSLFSTFTFPSHREPHGKESVDDRFPLDIGFKGPTATGPPANLRKENVYPGPLKPYVTRYKVADQGPEDNIEHWWGALSPYFESPKGFGYEEHELPLMCHVRQVHILSRHGSRFPTAGSRLKTEFAKKLRDHNFTAHGPLDILRVWEYKLGEAILVPIGKQQLYDHGVLTAMQYGDKLYRKGKKLVFRTTSQARMTESAIAFLEGAYGGDAWKEHVNLELIIEAPGFNNTLAPYNTCPESTAAGRMVGTDNRKKWEAIYLKERTEHFQKFIGGMNWTIADTAAIQQLCAYETNAWGYSPFCELFTMQEWRDFDYAESIWFSQHVGFGASTGRAQGIGWVNEFMRRIQQAPLDLQTLSSENTTLDGNPVYFPTDQPIYIDFTHDSVIAAVLTALDFKQFSGWLPPTGPEDPQKFRWSTSRMTPFAARLVAEIIQCDDDWYIHFILNGRTITLNHKKYGGGRIKKDGWHEFSSWLDGMSDRNEKANWQEACYQEHAPRERHDGRP